MFGLLLRNNLSSAPVGYVAKAYPPPLLVMEDSCELSISYKHSVNDISGILNTIASPYFV
jgi:hypothetical protein